MYLFVIYILAGYGGGLYQNCMKSVTCSCMSGSFYFDLRSWSSWKTAQTYKKWSALSIFGRCGPLPQDFSQVQAQIISCFIQIMRVCFIIAYPMIFILFCDQASHGECSNLWKMLSFKYFQLFGSFPSIFNFVK